MSLQKLKQRALDNTEVKAEYEPLEVEFNFIDQQLPIIPQAGNAQNKPGKNTNTKQHHLPLNKM